MQQCIFFSPESSRSVSKSSLQGDGTSYMYVTSVCGSSREAQLLSDASSVSMLFILLTAILSWNLYTYLKFNCVLLCDIKKYQTNYRKLQLYKITCKIFEKSFLWRQFCFVFFFLNESLNQTCLLHDVLTKALNYQTNLTPDTLLTLYMPELYVLSFLYRDSNKIFKR